MPSIDDDTVAQADLDDFNFGIAAPVFAPARASNPFDDEKASRLSSIGSILPPTPPNGRQSWTIGTNGRWKKVEDMAEHSPVRDPKPVSSPLTRYTIVTSMIGFALGAFITSLDAVIVSTSLPLIQKDLAVSATKFSWIGSAYLLAGAALMPLWGPISDVLGRKWTMVGGLCMFVIGNLIAALSFNADMLIAGRAVQGIGGTSFVVLHNICLADMFSLRERGLYLAVVAIPAAVGFATGPLISGLLTLHLSWRYCFWIMMPFGGTAAIIIAIFFPSSYPVTRGRASDLRKLDWIGVAMVTAGTVLLLVGLQFGGGTHPWDSGIVIGLIVAGVITLVGFVVGQNYMPQPIMPLRLFKERSRAACYVIASSHGFVYIACIYFLPLYFQIVLDFDAVKGGSWILILALTCAVFTGTAGWSVQKTGHYRLILVCSTGALTFASGLFIMFDPYRNYAQIVGFQIAVAAGIGTLFQIPQLVLQATVTPSEVTAANSSFIFIRALSSAISIVIGQVILQNEVRKQLSVMLDAGIPASFLVQLPTHIELFHEGGGLDDAQRQVLKEVLNHALRGVWIFITGCAAIGFIASLFVQHQELSTESAFKEKDDMSEERAVSPIQTMV
jgi:EmrB/QacA subfamily drug resistance transporter